MSKLSAVDFVAEAMRNVPEEEVVRLRDALDRHDSAEISACRAALRRLVGYVRLPSVKRPPVDIRRFRWVFSSPVELVAVEVSPLAYVALASMIATSRHPEDFGPQEERLG